MTRGSTVPSALDNLPWAVMFLIKQVIKIHRDYTTQLHQQTKINLIKTQFLKEWWFLGFSHSSMRILWCPEGSLKPGINWRCQKDLWRRHQVTGWDKDDGSLFNPERDWKEWCGPRRPEPDFWFNPWLTYLCCVNSLGPTCLTFPSPKKQRQSLGLSWGL